jgi:peptidoglycan/LPS O-acetylase OafA/YrhL
MRAAAVDSRRALHAQHKLWRRHDHSWRDGDCDTARSRRTGTGREEVSGMSHKRRIYLFAAVAVGVLLLFPAAALAAEKIDVGQNVANLLKGYATELYGGIVAVVSLMFLVNRRYTELAVFLFASIVVAWMVFASSDIATAAEAIGKQIFG